MFARIGIGTSEVLKKEKWPCLVRFNVDAKMRKKNLITILLDIT